MTMSHPYRRYRIAIDARLFRSATGGIGRYSRELLAHLFALDPVNDYTVYLTEADMAEWVFDFPNVTPVVVQIPHYSYAEQIKFYLTLRRERYDLVHFLNFNHPVLYKGPFVVTIHDLTLMIIPEAASKGRAGAIKQKVFQRVLKSAIRNAKRAIAITENTANDAARLLGVPQARMEVIHLGSPEKQDIPFGSKKLIQDYLGSRQPYILFLSQWRAHKGILTLLKAFEELKTTQDVPHQLVLLGRQENAPIEVRQAIAESPVAGDIVTPGFAPDELLPSLFAHASMYVMPSEYEGFGLPPLEAMTYGTPVILCDASSLPEIGGDAALYFPPRDSHTLATQMAELIANSDLARTLRERGFAQVNKFSWERCAQQTLGVYASILEKRHN